MKYGFYPEEVHNNMLVSGISYDSINHKAHIKHDNMK